MWLAKQQKREAAPVQGSVGRVTLGGEAPAVELDSERRGLEVYAPGGYRWRPAPGQKVLVLKADGAPCIAGTPAAGGLEPGEVELESAGGAKVRLDNQGGVTLSGNAAAASLSVAGTLTVGGVELTALVRSIAAAEAQKAVQEAK